MEKDLFVIFPDLPWSRRAARRQHPPKTNIARRGIQSSRRAMPDNRMDHAALRRIREIAEVEYRRLTPGDRRGRAFGAIIAITEAAIAR